MKTDYPREIALKVLYETDVREAYSNISLNRHLNSSHLDEKDRSFVTALVYGTIQWKLTLDWIITQFSSLPIKKISPWIMNILRLGLYQILYTDRIPAFAACDESVGLAKKFGHKGSSGFVNAILRNIIRSLDKITFPEKNKDLIGHLSVKYSHPAWMVKRWVERYGKAFTEELLNVNNSKPPLTLRVNTLKIKRDELIEKLSSTGMDPHPGLYSLDAIELKNTGFLTDSALFEKGLYQIQDEASMLAVHILDPREGEMVMDVCSAPGGKATHICQLMKNKGRVVAGDIYSHRLQLLKDTSQRLGTDIVEAVQMDAAITHDEYVNKADRVLVDAPCSGLGILRRKPDIKWSVSEDDIKSLASIQGKILDACAPYVKDGGILIYSTCTTEPEENIEVVKSFLDRNPCYKQEDISSFITGIVPEKSLSEGTLQLMPNINGTDGFFISKMKKG